MPVETPAVLASSPPCLDGLRVLAFCDYYGPSSAGGAERVAREVYTRLARSGAKVAVLTGVAGPGFDDPDVWVEPLSTINLSRLVGAQLTITPRMMRAAMRLVEQHQPDVLSAQTLHFHSSIVAARVARRTGIPLVTVAHVAGIEHLRGAARILAEAHEGVVGRSIVRSSSTIVAVSDSVHRHVVRRGGDPSAITVVPNGVDRESFPPRPPANNPVPHLLFVGRLIANKGPDLLLIAARSLHNLRIPFNMTFVGDGPLRDLLERDSLSAGLPVEFVGPSDHVAGWMARADVVVRPSLTEGMPLTVLEAMSSARCVVASAIPANAELVIHGVTGLLHRPADANDLTAQLRRLIEDGDLRLRLASAAARASERFTWDRTANAHGEALLNATSC